MRSTMQLSRPEVTVYVVAPVPEPPLGTALICEPNLSVDVTPRSTGVVASVASESDKPA